MSDIGLPAATSANPVRRLEVRRVLAVLLAWFGAAGLIVEGRSQDLESDKRALIALYNATDGANWNVNHGWLSDDPLETWFGVIVSAGRVRQLVLNGNGLTGSIPAELGNLAHLASVTLSDNQLTGPIPAELGDLANLSRLYLSGNRLTGPIPQSLTNLRLAHFYFHGNPGLSVPDNMAFREWLGGIPELRDQAYSPLTLFVPAILNSSGRNKAFFTSEMTLTNRGAVPAYLTYSYTAHIGGGSGILTGSY